MTEITTARPARNGVDVPTLFATLDAVKASPEIADFRFRQLGDAAIRRLRPVRCLPGGRRWL